MGYTADELATLNCVQKHQQVLFLSDILGAGGGSVEKCYLHKRQPGEHWSSMKFPREEVTASEMELWCRVIVQVVSHGPAQATSVNQKKVLTKINFNRELLIRSRKN